MITAREVIDAALERAQRTKDGPWTVADGDYPDRSTVKDCDGENVFWGTEMFSNAETFPAEADFIACARTDVPRFGEALKAVLELPEMTDFTAEGRGYNAALMYMRLKIKQALEEEE